MTDRKYVGARYVPLVMGEWDSTATYEPLSIVLHEGNSYTSRSFVPAGISIDNDMYWALSGNYNAQVETYDRRIDDLEGKFPVDSADIADSAITSAKIADGAVTGAKLASGAFAQNEVIVILGDSWADPDVADASEWPGKLATMFDNAEIHNYALNGCHTSNDSFQTMYNAFVNDTTWDKSTITRVVFVYGVNDVFTYPITREATQTSIMAFYNSVISQIPANVPIHWFINHCYGKHTCSFTEQIYFWHAFMINVLPSCPRLIPHETWDWFNVAEYNQSNFFHLLKNTYNGHWVNNVYKCMTGGAPDKFATYQGSLGDTHPVTLLVDVQETGVLIKAQWIATTDIINHYILEPNPAHFPIEISTNIGFAVPSGFAKLSSGSHDAIDVDRVTLVSTAATADTAGTLCTCEYMLQATI